ncbi:unnamed protein product [Caenorhabditis auriculariae]|uniref:NAD(P)H-hydrate epimerase n=1 Tax=Caenorhabditis auriculariae TaxID=2777116 RepID=A0A8S1GM07_9PELO|nr:unnamed protein product [Caenorhabditis auriculariae]
MVSRVSKKTISYISQSVATKIDDQLFSQFGFKVEQLMELAGLAAAQAVAAHYPKGNVAVLCGPGNNGGDGFVCARHLQQFGFSTHVVYPKTSRNKLMECLVEQCQKLDIPVTNNLPDLKNFTLIVDALFGFSFKPPVREPFDAIIGSILQSGLPVFSIDIPSGWDVKDGPPADGVCIRPDAVISLTLPKECMRDWNGTHFVGGRFVPASLARDFQLSLPSYPSFDQIVQLAD